MIEFVDPWENEAPTHRTGDIEPLLRKRDVARILNVSLRTVDRLLASGELPLVKMGDKRLSPIRVRPAALRAYIDRKTTL